MKKCPLALVILFILLGLGVFLGGALAEDSQEASLNEQLVQKIDDFIDSYNDCDFNRVVSLGNKELFRRSLLQNLDIEINGSLEGTDAKYYPSSGRWFGSFRNNLMSIKSFSSTTAIPNITFWHESIHHCVNLLYGRQSCAPEEVYVELAEDKIKWLSALRGFEKLLKTGRINMSQFRDFWKDRLEKEWNDPAKNLSGPYSYLFTDDTCGNRGEVFTIQADYIKKLDAALGVDIDINKIRPIYFKEVEITSPQDNGFVRGTAQIRGSASAENFIQYSISYAFKYAPETSLGVIAHSERPVSDGILGRWDTGRDSLVDGKYILTLKVKVASDKEIIRTVEVNLDNVNDAPRLVGLIDKNALVGRELRFKVNAEDADDPETPEGQIISLSASGDLAQCFDPDTKIFSWTPTKDFLGKTYSVTFKVMDRGGRSEEESINISVSYFNITNLTNDYNYQFRPHIHKDKVVWEDDRNTIDIYDLNTGEKSIVSPAKADRQQRWPHLTSYKDKGKDKEVVVWENKQRVRDGEKEKYEYSLYKADLGYDKGQERYNISESKLTELEGFDDSSYGSSYQIDVYADKVIYRNKKENETYCQHNALAHETNWGVGNLYIYDLIGGNTWRITCSRRGHSGPSIYGNKAVWYEAWGTDRKTEDCPYVSGNCGSLVKSYQAIAMGSISAESPDPRYLDTFEGQEVPSTQVGYVDGEKVYHVSSPLVSGDKVIWLQETYVRRMEPRYHTQLLSRVLRVGEGQLVLPLDKISSLAFYGDKIVCAGVYKGEKTWSIYLYDLKGGGLKETEIYSLEYGSETPVYLDIAIYGDKIVWGDADGDIILAAIASPPQITSVSPLAVFPQDEVYIKGDNFGHKQGDSRVEFVKNKVASITGWRNKEIICTVPDDAEIGPSTLTLVTPAGDFSFSKNIIIKDRNHPPSAQDDSYKMSKNGIQGIILKASDPDQDILEYSIVTNPLYGEIQEIVETEAGEKMVIYTPNQDYTGEDSLTFKVNDGKKDSNLAKISITITAAEEEEHGGNFTPILDPIGDKETEENKLLEFTLSASDPDADALIYSAFYLPEGAVFNATTKTFSWKPNPNQVGSYRVKFEVSDRELTDAEEITITVKEVK